MKFWPQMSHYEKMPHIAGYAHVMRRTSGSVSATVSDAPYSAISDKQKTVVFVDGKYCATYSEDELLRMALKERSDEYALAVRLQK